MVQTQPQFTPKQILEAGQRAVAEGRTDYARQFFQHLIDHYADTTEAANARNEMLSLGSAKAAPLVAANAPDLRVARSNVQSDPASPLEPTRQPSSSPMPSSTVSSPMPVQARRLAPLPEKNYIAGRVLTGILGFFGLLGLPLGFVMLYGVFADPSLFGIIAVARFADALGLSALVLLASIALIVLSQTARAVFDAADAASDLARLERYRLELEDVDDEQAAPKTCRHNGMGAVRDC